jgi:hypothetical protein
LDSSPPANDTPEEPAPHHNNGGLPLLRMAALVFFLALVREACVGPPN